MHCLHFWPSLSTTDVQFDRLTKHTHFIPFQIVINEFTHFFVLSITLTSNITVFDFVSNFDMRRHKKKSDFCTNCGSQYDDEHKYVCE